MRILFAIMTCLLITSCGSYEGGQVTHYDINYSQYYPLQLTDFDPPEGAESIGTHSTCVTVGTKVSERAALDMSLDNLVKASNNKQAHGAAGLSIKRDVSCNQNGCYTRKVCVSAELWVTDDSVYVAQRIEQLNRAKLEAEIWTAPYTSKGWNSAGLGRVTKSMTPKEAKSWFKSIPVKEIKTGNLRMKEHEGLRYILPVLAEWAEVTFVAIERL